MDEFIWVVPYLVVIAVVAFIILTIMQLRDSRSQERKIDRLLSGIGEWQAQHKISKEDVDVLLKKSLGENLILNESVTIEINPR